MRYTVGWKITDEDERAIARLPESVWETSVPQDGSLQDRYFVAELTSLSTRPRGLTRGHAPDRPPDLSDPTTPEEADRVREDDRLALMHHRDQHPPHVGHHRLQFLDVLHRSHAGAEDRVRTGKAMGLDNLPSAS